MNNVVKSQHYVPRCYLSNFCSRGEMIWAFDKSNENIFEPNIINMAQENYFYDIPEESHESGDPQFLEKAFAKLEGEFKQLLNNVLVNAPTVKNISPRKNPIVIDEVTKGKLSLHIAIQAIRTKEFRDMINQSFEKTLAKTAQLFMDSLPPKLTEGVKVEIKREYESLEQAKFITNGDTLQRFSNIFFNHIWIIGLNGSSMPLITSDHPVSKHGRVKKPFSGVGYNSPGVEVNFPLSPNINLAMYEKSQFGHEFEHLDGCLTTLSMENVEFLNSLQVNNSHRFLFSNTNEFTIPKLMIADTPELKNINAPKIIVD